MLEREGILIKKSDPGHKQKIIYTLTEKGIDLLPILIEIGNWSAKYNPINERDKAHAKMLQKGGEKLQKEIKKQFMMLLKNSNPISKKN